MSMKFKVGDKVKVVGKAMYCQPYKGRVHTVIKVFRGDVWPYMLDRDVEEPYFRAHELEKVESKNGQA